MMPLGMSDTQTVEETMKMSPMDLYDSIFWGKDILDIISPLKLKANTK